VSLPRAAPSSIEGTGIAKLDPAIGLDAAALRRFVSASHPHARRDATASVPQPRRRAFPPAKAAITPRPATALEKVPRGGPSWRPKMIYSSRFIDRIETRHEGERVARKSTSRGIIERSGRVPDWTEIQISIRFANIDSTQISSSSAVVCQIFRMNLE
jgi:hypothetical protein